MVAHQRRPVKGGHAAGLEDPVYLGKCDSSYQLESGSGQEPACFFCE